MAGGLRQARFRKGLVGLQVALSLLLLVGAGLFARTLFNLRQLGPGFSATGLLAFNVDPSLNSYETPRAKAFYTQLVDELRAVPGVTDVGLAAVGILQDNEWDSSVTVEGHVPAPGEYVNPFMNSISPGYFAALGVPILEGRDFTLRDTDEVKHGVEGDEYVPRVVIVNEKFAKKYFPGTISRSGRPCSGVKGSPSACVASSAPSSSRNETGMLAVKPASACAIA